MEADIKDSNVLVPLVGEGSNLPLGEVNLFKQEKVKITDFRISANNTREVML